MKALLPAYCRLLGYAILLLSIFSPGIQAINGMVATVVLHVVFNLVANKKN